MVNIIFVVFWILFYVYVNFVFLVFIWVEVEVCIEIVCGEDGMVIRIINIVMLKVNCFLLLFFYQEIFCYVGMGMLVREVMQDMYLDGYFFKKGVFIQMFIRVVYFDLKFWGENVNDFVLERFLFENKFFCLKESCFRIFGGGKMFCFGRYFVMNEILVVVVVFVVRLEMELVDKEKGWEVLISWNMGVVGQIMVFDRDVEVDIKRREGVEEGWRWVVRVDKGDKVFRMVMEDFGDEQGGML